MAPQHADNERHLPHWCFPGRGVGKGRQKEKQTALCISASMGAHPWVFPEGLIPNWAPPCSVHPSTPVGQSCCLVLGRATQSSTSPLPQLLPGRTFPLLGKPRGLVEGRNSSKHFTLFIFPQLDTMQVGSTSGCLLCPVLAELSLLPALGWVQTFQHIPKAPGQCPWAKSHCRGLFLGVLSCWGQGSWDESTWDTSLPSSGMKEHQEILPLFPPELQQQREAGKCACSP